MLVTDVDLTQSRGPPGGLSVWADIADILPKRMYSPTRQIYPRCYSTTFFFIICSGSKLTSQVAFLNTPH